MAYNTVVKTMQEAGRVAVATAAAAASKGCCVSCVREGWDVITCSRNVWEVIMLSKSNGALELNLAFHVVGEEYGVKANR